MNGITIGTSAPVAPRWQAGGTRPARHASAIPTTTHTITTIGTGDGSRHGYTVRAKSGPYSQFYMRN